MNGLLTLVVEQLAQGGKPRVAGALRGALAALEVLVLAAVGAEPLAVVAAQPPHRDLEEELLPHHLPEVDPVVVVEHDDHLVVAQLDVGVLLFRLGLAVAGQVEEVDVLVDLVGEGLEAAAAFEPQARAEPPLDLDGVLFALLDVDLEPALLELEAPLALEMDLSRVEDGVDVLPFGRDLGDVDDEHGLCAQTANSTRNDCPAASGPTPKFSARVAPRSAKVSLSPRFLPAPTFGPRTRRGTFSRVWSVDTSDGSQPWSAVRMKTSSSRMAAK